MVNFGKHIESLIFVTIANGLCLSLFKNFSCLNDKLLIDRAKKAKIELKNYFEFNNMEFPENTETMIENLENMRSISPVSNDRLNSIINIAENFNIVEQHKNVSDIQRVAYNTQRKDQLSLKKQILIEVDFKQKIVIGLSPRQINKEFYSQETRSCLGIF